jgi:hypothetical protein
MIELPGNLYSKGILVASELKVWLNKPAQRSKGIFRVPASLELRSGAKYRIELFGEPAGPPHAQQCLSLDVVITGVSNQIAHFTTAPRSE